MSSDDELSRIGFSLLCPAYQNEMSKTIVFNIIRITNRLLAMLNAVLQAWEGVRQVNPINELFDPCHSNIKIYILKNVK